MGKILLVACTNVGRYIIEELMTNPQPNVELVGVVNLNATQGCVKANYDTYSDLVLKYDLNIHYCNNINDAQTVKFMKDLMPDIILQSGWSQKFSDEVLSVPKYCCIGEHPAPLPKGRGAACVNWALITGETDWGDSYFEMVSEYDKGRLFAQRSFNIAPYDNVFTVYEKVAHCATQVIREYAAKWTEGIFNSIVQDDSKATYYKKRRPDDGEIKDFSLSAEEYHNFIRAQTNPYPGAFIKTEQGKIYLLSSDVTDLKTDKKIGTVIDITNKGGILIACGNNTVLEVLRVKEESKPSMWACDKFKAGQIL